MQVAGGTSRLSAGSDLESFEENPDQEARLRESGIALPMPASGLENAPPASKAVGPIAVPLNFEGIVSIDNRLPARASGRDRARC